MRETKKRYLVLLIGYLGTVPLTVLLVGGFAVGAVSLWGVLIATCSYSYLLSQAVFYVPVSPSGATHE